LTETGRDFNGTLNKAISETIQTLLGPTVLQTLNRVLDEKHSVTADELPCRLETLWEVLENGFGHVSSRTVGRQIAKNFYSKLGLQFVPNPEWTLRDYVEEAKRKVAELP